MPGGQASLEAVSGVYLRDHGASVDGAAARVGCGTKSIKNASRIRKSAIPALWRLVENGQIRVGGALDLIRDLETMFPNDRPRQRAHQLKAIRCWRRGDIKYIRHYPSMIRSSNDGRIDRNYDPQSQLSVLPTRQGGEERQERQQQVDLPL